MFLEKIFTLKKEKEEVQDGKFLRDFLKAMKKKERQEKSGMVENFQGIILKSTERIKKKPFSA